MRIEFPNSTREQFHWDAAALRIGSAADNDLILADHQVARHHLRIQFDRRGWVLQVLPEGERVYVNARPVREKALLRAGDVLSIGDCRMLLRADAPPSTDPLPKTERCTVALRAVAGPLSGRALPLQDRLELGPGSRVSLELPQGETASLAVFWRDGQLLIESVTPSVRYPLRLNGVSVQQAALRSGDQFGLAMHRFVVDAPGLQPEVKPVPAELTVEPKPQRPIGRGKEVGWLIVTAVLLALGIAAALLVHR